MPKIWTPRLWRSKDELLSDVLLWTPTHGCARVGRPARTYIQQLCEDTGCNPEDLPEAMNDREKWRETVRDIRAGGATWWWWWYEVLIWFYIFLKQRLPLVKKISCQNMNFIFKFLISDNWHKGCVITKLEFFSENEVINCFWFYSYPDLKRLFHNSLIKAEASLIFSVDIILFLFSDYFCK